jgi:hypothetical protein
MLARLPKSELAARRARNRERTAAWRDRNRRGVVELLTIEITATEIDLTVQLGLLADDEVDPRKIKAGVAAMLRTALAMLREHGHSL